MMITGWILVVLQATANHTNGWQPIGNFAFKSDCENAVVQLQSAYVPQDKFVMNMKYLCIRQSRNST
jgi:hypothetical protein